MNEIDLKLFIEKFNSEKELCNDLKQLKILTGEFLYKLNDKLSNLENYEIRLKNPEIKLENNLHILEKAHQILTDRGSDKAKDYGPFHKSMGDAASIASRMTGLNIDDIDFYKCMMALKLARLAHSHNEDTFLDLIAYSASLNDLINDK